MMSPNKVPILCRYGGDIIEESGKVSYKDGTNRIILLRAQEINYPGLLSKLLEVCNWTQIGSIKFKHPELGLDCLISVENDEDLCNMMQAFQNQNNGLIHLFIFKAQDTLAIRNTIPSDKEIVKATEENHRASKAMQLQPTNINADTAGLPMELGMDVHNLPTNSSTESGYANNNMALPLRPRMELEDGQEFPDANAFHKFLREYAIRLNFEYKRTRSGHGRFAAKCIKKDCPWRIQAIRLSNQSTFKIKSFEGKHTCSNVDKHLKVTSHYQATRKWIADIVERRNYFQCTPKVIADVIEKEYKIKVGYHKAWRGRELAWKSTSIEKLCEDIRRTNPGSRITMQSKSTDNNNWKLFVSYEAAVIPIFQMTCRPIVRLVSAKVEGKRPFVWLMAMGKDTRAECLLLACGFIELDEQLGEDLFEDYKWFCRELFHILGRMTNLVFMVDHTHEGGVLEVVRSIFPHSHCRYDQLSFARDMGNKFDALTPSLLSRAMATLKQSVFDEEMSGIKRQCGEAWEFLRNVNPEYWAVSHFKGAFGSGIFFDPWWIKECSHKQGVLIHELVEHVHGLMMETFTGRVERSSKWTSILLPEFEDASLHLDPVSNLKILESTTPATRFRLSSSKNDHSVEVDIYMRNCSCGEWQIYGHPCGHAERVIKALQLNRYEYWDDCYKTAAYNKAYSLAVIRPLRRHLKIRRLVNEMIAFLK